MTRITLAIGLALALTARVYADVTISSTASGKGPGLSANVAITTYVKGLRMRVDVVSGNKTLTTIYDVPGQKMYVFDSKAKEADVWDMAAFAKTVAKAVKVGDIKASIRTNHQTKQFSGQTAVGYDVEISVPTAPNGNSGMYMTTRLGSQAWVVKDSPGTADYTAFYRGAAESGWTFEDPKSTKALPGHALAMAKMYEQYATLGGVPYESTTNSKSVGHVGSEFTPGAPHGVSAARTVFDRSLTNTIQAVDTSTLSADLFMPPPGYRLNVRK